MNEADSPDQQSGLPIPIEPVQMPAVSESIAAEATPPTTSDGWQTVDFPGAMSIDTIPHTSVDEQHTDGWRQTEALGEATPQGIIHYSSAELNPVIAYSAVQSAETADHRMQLQQLQQENVALRDRLLQVERAGVEPIEGQAGAAFGAGSVLEPTQERIEQLLQELERSHQTAQRQQILVETLTEQLGSSQERIAQLERDCALTQQRHNEQVQQVLQAESQCRDLRLRLHRQQQQTLQFKAALEKCLEMPTVYGTPAMPDVALASDTVVTDALSAFLPKNSPVQPWSLAEKASQALADQTRLPRSLFKLLQHGALAPDDAVETTHELAQGHDVLAYALTAPFSDRSANSEPMSVDPSALLDSDDPQFVTHLMQLIFPTTADPSSYVAAETLEPDPLLDVSSFVQADLETECVDTVGLSASDVSSAVIFISPDRPSNWATESLATAAEGIVSANPDAIANTSPETLPADHSTDPLWDDLATLIDPELSSESVNPEAAAVVNRPESESAPPQMSMASSRALDPVPLDNRLLPSLPTSTAAIPPIFAADAATPTAASSSEEETATAQTGWTWRDRLVSAGKVARAINTEQATQPAKLLALSAAGRQSIPPQPASVSSPTALAPIAVAVPPSPIVYPQRSTKKLASLAAVDLPTFPKR